MCEWLDSRACPLCWPWTPAMSCTNEISQTEREGACTCTVRLPSLVKIPAALRQGHTTRHAPTRTQSTSRPYSHTKREICSLVATHTSLH